MKTLTKRNLCIRHPVTSRAGIRARATAGDRSVSALDCSKWRSCRLGAAGCEQAGIPAVNAPVIPQDAWIRHSFCDLSTATPAVAPTMDIGMWQPLFRGVHTISLFSPLSRRVLVLVWAGSAVFPGFTATRVMSSYLQFDTRDLFVLRGGMIEVDGGSSKDPKEKRD